MEDRVVEQVGREASCALGRVENQCRTIDCQEMQLMQGREAKMEGEICELDTEHSTFGVPIA